MIDQRIIRRCLGSTVAIAAFACFSAPIASAQIMGPLIAGKLFELGFSYKHTHTEYKLSGGENVADLSEDYWDGSVFFRFGANNWVTLSGEAMLGDVRMIEESIGDTRYYLFGLGIQTRVLRGRGYTVAAGIHYVDKLAFSQNRETCDFRFGSLTGIVQAEKPVRILKHRVTVWGGPAYEYGFEDRFLSDRCEKTEWRSLQNLGVTLGADMVFHDHLRADAHLLYIRFLQPRFTLSWLF